MLGVAAALIAFAPPPGAAPAPSSDCAMRLEAVADAPRFEDYRADPRRVALPAPLMLGSREARRYRSLIGAQSSQGPNFAGDYTIVAWGCGASCTAFAIVDARTGRAHFPAGLGAIGTAHAGYGGPDSPLRYNALRFRADSRLIAILGAPDEEEARDGISFFEWTGRALRPVRFVPRRELCGH